MSTRANIILKEGEEQLWFYRHSDGYPDGTLPTLNIFMDWLKTGKIRNNLSQGAGWLIALGIMEYNTLPLFKTEPDMDFGSRKIKGRTNLESIESPLDWKVGAYEPTTGEHGDIEWLYTIDLDKKELTYREV